ncbi:MAG: hypothetical protein WCE87_14065 [Candidatus Udaeobacter sp.]
MIGIETTDRDLSTPDDVVSPSVLTGLQAIVPQVLPRSTTASRPVPIGGITGLDRVFWKWSGSALDELVTAIRRFRPLPDGGELRTLTALAIICGVPGSP